jgi:hypothetical protein
MHPPQSAQADFVLFQRRIHSLWTAGRARLAADALHSADPAPPFASTGGRAAFRSPRRCIRRSPRRRTSCFSSGEFIRCGQADAPNHEPDT